MSDASLFVGREVGVRRGSFCNKRTRLTPTSITTEISRCFGGWSAVFGSGKVFVQVITTAVGYKRRRRKFFFASL